MIGWMPRSSANCCAADFSRRYTTGNVGCAPCGSWAGVIAISKDLTRVRNRLKALYRSWAIPCAGQKVYSPRHRSDWLEKLSEVRSEVARRASLSTAGQFGADSPGSTAPVVEGEQAASCPEASATDSPAGPAAGSPSDRVATDPASVPDSRR